MGKTTEKQDEEIFFTKEFSSEENGILHQLGGVHRCCLSNPIHLDYVSEGFCDLTGYDEADFFGPEIDSKYSRILVPEDVETFRKFIKTAATEDGCQTCQYRIVKKDGSVISVHDTMVPKVMDDGVRWGYSVVTISDGSLQDGSVDEDSRDFDLYCVVDCVWNDAGTSFSVPHCNNMFLELLGFDHDAIQTDYRGIMAVVNLVMKKSVSLFVSAEHSHSTVEHHRGFLRRVDNTFVEVSCWEREVSDNPRKVRLMCVPVSDETVFKRKANLDEFIAAMKVVYDLVVEVDIVRGLAECVHSSVPNYTLLPSGVPIDFKSAVELIGNNYFDVEIKDHFNETLAEITTLNVPVDGCFSRHFMSEVYIQENAYPVDVLFYRTDNTLLIMAKLLAEVDVRAQEPHKRVRISTFGYFEVFVDDEPLVFKHPKSRELLALLVDRRGGVISSREAAQLLWEDEEIDRKVMSRFRKVAMQLSETLEEAGVSEIVETAGRARKIMPSFVNCDLYNFLGGGEEAETRFSGSYMRDYSWAEVTCGELTFLSRDRQLAMNSARPSSH